jgi:nickel superoxide dismutase
MGDFSGDGMMKRLILCAALIGACLLAQSAVAHCEIPCGIYDDDLRLKLIAEHITTIEKSMKSINKLSSQGAKSGNQIVRWIGNKEKHASEIQEIVSQYFLTQRIKPVDPKDAVKFKKYTRELMLLHQIMISAMKAKQTTDLAHAKKLRELLVQFKASYFGKVAHSSSRKH